MGQFEYLRKAEEEYRTAVSDFKAASAAKNPNSITPKAQKVLEAKKAAVGEATNLLFAARQIAAVGVSDDTLAALCK